MMTEGMPILFIVSIAIMAVSLLIMVVIYYRIRLEKREYTNGNKYEDEYGSESLKLKAKIPYCGLVFLLGFLVFVFNCV
ncbi:MAG: hypothetical protein R3Y51_02640 [Rikenellaceae bacterium]